MDNEEQKEMEKDLVIEFTNQETNAETQTTEKKETRGRKKLTEEEKKEKRNERDRKRREANKNTNTNEEKKESKVTQKSIDDILNEHNKTVAETIEASTEQEQETEENKHVNTKKISGVILLTVIDVFFPLLIVKIGGMFSKKIKQVDFRKLKLTDEEKQDLSEIADEVAMLIEMNPILLFSISVGGVYFSKLATEI